MNSLPSSQDSDRHLQACASYLRRTLEHQRKICTELYHWPCHRSVCKNCLFCPGPRRQYTSDSIAKSKSNPQMEGFSFQVKHDTWSDEQDNAIQERAQMSCTDSYKSLLPVVRVANVFGLLPLSIDSSRGFRFLWTTFRTLYALVVLSTLVGLVVLRLVSIVMCMTPSEDWVRVFTSTAFYALGASGAFLLFSLARKLPRVWFSWAQWECRVGVANSTRCFVVIVMAAVLLSATGETAFSMFYKLPVNCTNDVWTFIQCYVTAGHKHEIELLGYNNVLGVTIVIINKYATFIWNFNDVLVTCTALVLSRHIKTYNCRIEKGCQSWNGKDWRVSRDDHLTLINLMNSVNEALGPIVLQSYVTNLFFTIVQLYLGIIPLGSEEVIARMYLTWSFLHLLGRLVLVSFTCTAVYDASKKSIIHMLNVPAEKYNVEVWRLQQQIQEQEVGMSGCGFFLVNRNFILAAVGALVTYEVILLQLNFSDALPEAGSA